jgi:hypothetical protein
MYIIVTVCCLHHQSGIYGVRGTIDTSMTSMNEPFNPGAFKVIGWLCEGSCGGKHSHEYTLSIRQNDFIITM